MMQKQTVPLMVYSAPMTAGFSQLFEPFEISGLVDPRLASTLSECKGTEAGDLIYVQLRRPLDGTEKGEVRFPDGKVVNIVEYFITVVFRWSGEGWNTVMPA